VNQMQQRQFGRVVVVTEVRVVLQNVVSNIPEELKLTLLVRQARSSPGLYFGEAHATNSEIP
jgi:hypothetical protein